MRSWTLPMVVTWSTQQVFTSTGTVSNLPPTASILASPQCSWSGECSYLVLYSSGSADPEGNDLSYFWTVTGSDGTTVNYMTSSVTIMLAGQTSFMVTLVVSDGELLSEPAQAFVEIP